jgi:hypothetical protein
VQWEQRGQLLSAPLPVDWARSHAALPHARPLADGRVRIYLSARDDLGRSHIGFGDFDPGSSDAEVALAASAILDPGPRGAFDDNGVTTSCLVQHGDLHYLYYTGWSLGHTVPFYLYVGLAVSEDGERFERVSSAPVLERSNVDPFLTASPWVMVDEGRWRMWYVSATHWEIVNGGVRHSYHVRYAESDDGISWRRDGYRMWFSARGASYRVGYAESPDGITWHRKDELAGIERTGDWDAEMQAYPSVFDHEGRRYLLYNGNGYGRAGIGWAAAIASA